MPRTPKFFALLRYDDANAAVDWLAQAFGFTVHFAARNPDGKVVHAQLRMGDDLVMISPAIPGDKYGMKGPRSLPGRSQCVCVALEEVDAHHDRAVANGAVVITPLEDTDFGARQYVCLDPEGHIWTFSNYWGEPGSERT